MHAVSFVDILPTFIDLVGGTAPAGDAFDGQSFMHLLERAGGGTDRGVGDPLSLQTAAGTSQYVFGMQTTRGILCSSTPYPSRMATDGEWKYIRNYNHEHISQSPGFTCLIGDERFSPYSSVIMEEIYSGGPKAHWAKMILCRPKEELYYLGTDTYEMHNVVGLAQNAKKLTELRWAMDAWMKQQGDNDPVTTEAKVPFRLDNNPRGTEFNTEARHANEKCSALDNWLPARAKPTPGACAWGVEYHFTVGEPNVKYKAGSNAWAPNPEECMSACYHDSTCRAYAYGTNSDGSNCFFYTSIDDANRMTVNERMMMKFYRKSNRCPSGTPPAVVDTRADTAHATAAAILADSGVTICPHGGLMLNFSAAKSGKKGKYLKGKGYLRKEKTTGETPGPCAAYCLKEKDCVGFSWTPGTLKANCIMHTALGLSRGLLADKDYNVWYKEDNCPSTVVPATAVSTSYPLSDIACSRGIMYDFEDPIQDRKGKYRQGDGYLSRKYVGDNNLRGCVLMCLQTSACKGLSFGTEVKKGDNGNCILLNDIALEGQKLPKSKGWNTYTRSATRCSQADAPVAEASTTTVTTTTATTTSPIPAVSAKCKDGVLSYFAAPQIDRMGAFKGGKGFILKRWTDHDTPDTCAQLCLDYTVEHCEGISWSKTWSKPNCVLHRKVAFAKRLQQVDDWLVYIRHSDCEQPLGETITAATTAVPASTIATTDAETMRPAVLGREAAEIDEPPLVCADGSLYHFAEPLNGFKGRKIHASAPGVPGVLSDTWDHVHDAGTCAEACVKDRRCEGFAWAPDREKRNFNCVFYNTVGMSSPPLADTMWDLYGKQDRCPSTKLRTRREPPYVDDEAAGNTSTAYMALGCIILSIVALAMFTVKKMLASGRLETFKHTFTSARKRKQSAITFLDDDEVAEPSPVFSSSHPHPVANRRANITPELE